MTPEGGYGHELLRALLALLFVSGLAFAALRFASKRGLSGLGLGAIARGDARVTVLSRIALEPRKSLYLVKVDDRVLLLGSGEAGPPSLIADLGTGTGSVPASGSASDSDSASVSDSGASRHG